ncbi:transporter substrate-binding domain-containing protein [Stappia sp. F7233]|uniref:Transporter substrate-binding domain-containing protein n=1 Tax=Stappia albiluteola TaxID=2758565 RepID=A0A839AFD7_9HYPH|nr:transporter substrate-binding domain-containing protein [Stappia albiluteola]MBA5778560.1 transporter substrate-binding domain-containing protein [Stappia albiluteola]
MKGFKAALRWAMAVSVAAFLLALGGLAATPAVAGAMEDAVKRGSLRIGIAEEDFLPWIGRDADGNRIGFEVDVGQDLARVLGVTPDFVELPFDDLPYHLIAGDVDVIVSALSVTAARARTMLFSIPYGTTDYWLVVDKDTLPESAKDGEYDVAGYKVGVMAGSLAEIAAARFFKQAEIVPLADEGAARDALENSELNAIIVPSPYPTYMMERRPDRFLLGSDSLFSTSEAVAARPDSLRFINFVDAWITENRGNGRLDQAYDYWFGSTDWMDRLDKTLGESDERPAGEAPKPQEKAQ